MRINRRSFLNGAALLTVGPLPRSAAFSNGPQPYGVLPSSRQLAWSRLEYYNFLHFTVNTFTDKEWGYGDEDPRIFNPADFDADAIVQTLRDSGSRGVILTCKHHDGFCLWPTKTTEHSIKNSAFRNGKGDIVKEVAQAAQRHGLKFGVYVSPWDRNQATYGHPEYLTIYRRQLHELLTGYGPVFEIWHDGANGGDGFYGGAREKRTIDKLHYYEWDKTWALERELQPEAAIFSDVGPDIRWVGNEKGRAGDTCWATYTPRSPQGGPGSPGDVVEAEATTGTLDGKYWMPAECDVSIRPGWFWHQSENGAVKTGRDLLDLYYESVGRGASFLLNVPPDRRGLLSDPDVASLRTFGTMLEKTFATNLAAGSQVHASSVRQRGKQSFDAGNVLDDKRDTYWAADDAVKTAELTITLSRPVHFDLIRLREAIQLGQRIRAFELEYWLDGSWKSFGSGTSVGICRIVRAKSRIITTQVRLRITDASACPALSDFGIFAQAAG